MNDQFPSDEFDASAFESPQLRAAREEFEQVEALNQQTLAEFDPSGGLDRVSIVLSTTDDALETDAPQVFVALQDKMLSGLGLLPESLEPDDPRRLFEYAYSDGIEQIRLITRADGVEVPVATSLSYTQNSAEFRIDDIELLTHDEAAERKQQLERNLDQQLLDMRLRDEFGMDADFLESASLTLEDKRAMIRAYDEIQTIETAKPDARELDKIRARLVRSIFPTTKVTAAIYGRKTEKLATEYEDAVKALINKHELDGGSARDLLASERLKRLAALNERLGKRSRNAKIGKLALLGTATVVGVGGGVLAGYTVGATTGGEEILMLSGAAVGGGSGALLTAEAMRNHKKTEKSLIGFQPHYVPPRGEVLKAQIRHEKALAQRYSFELTTPR